jgi:hypothetical protein
LERQLLGQYMQPPDRGYGVLLLVRRDERKWRLSGKHVELAELVAHLQGHGRALGARQGKEIFVAVIDLLATPLKPESAAPKTKRPTKTKTTNGRTVPKKKKASAKTRAVRSAKKAARR